MGKKAVWIAGFLTIIGLVAGLTAGYYRFLSETNNKTVSLAASYDEMKALAGMNSIAFSKLLTHLKSSGVSTIVITERTFANLNASGLIQVQTFDNGPTIIKVSPKAEHLVRDCVKRRFAPLGKPVPVGNDVQTLFVFQNETIPTTVDFQSIALTGAGIDSADVEIVRLAGLEPIAQFINSPGADSGTIKRILSQANELNIKTVMFGLEEVLGSKTAIETTAQAIREFNFNYASIELTKQAGDAKLSSLVPDHLIRAHSPVKLENGNLAHSVLRERYKRAVIERNIRLCYIRFYTDSGNKPIDDVLSLYSNINNDLTKDGFNAGIPKPFANPGVPRWLYLIIGIGVGASIWFMKELAVILGARSRIVMILLTLVLGLAGWVSPGRSILALLAAIVFPLIALIFAVRLPIKSPLVKALLGLVAAVITTLCGAGYVVGLLTDQPYLLSVMQFSGIKLAMIIPVLLSLVVFASGMVQKTTLKAALRKLIEFRNSPVLWWMLGGLFFGAGILAYMLIRSGNEGSTSATELELTFRSSLDSLLAVRPRTKEFLIGHPFLLLALWLIARGKNKFLPVLLMIGAIGQVSVLNTFCHTHTPLALSLTRVCNGLLTGAVTGLVLIGIVFILEKIPWKSLLDE